MDHQRFAGVLTAVILSLAVSAKADGPAGMKLIPAGEFVMGTDDAHSLPNERPAHRVKLDSFWMDEHDVTNAEFKKFAEATGYLTTAEKPVNWEEIKKQ